MSIAIGLQLNISIMSLEKTQPHRQSHDHRGWRGGATVGRRTCDQEVASSIHGQGAAAYDDSGQVVHTQLPRR